jgi:hypothetical protein
MSETIYRNGTLRVVGHGRRCRGRRGRALDGLRVRIRPTALAHVDEILRVDSTVLADHVRRCWEESSKQASCCFCSTGVNRNHVLGGHSVLSE